MGANMKRVYLISTHFEINIYDFQLIGKNQTNNALRQVNSSSEMPHYKE